MKMLTLWFWKRMNRCGWWTAAAWRQQLNTVILGKSAADNFLLYGISGYNCRPRQSNLFYVGPVPIFTTQRRHLEELTNIHYQEQFSHKFTSNALRSSLRFEGKKCSCKHHTAGSSRVQFLDSVPFLQSNVQSSQVFWTWTGLKIHTTKDFTL